MRKRGVVILMAAALTASVPATALADQFAGQIALNGEAASEDVADEDSQVDMDQTEEADDEDIFDFIVNGGDADGTKE